MRQWSCRPLVALPWGLSFPAAIDKPKNDKQEADSADQGAGYDDGVTVTLLFTQVMVQVRIPRYCTCWLMTVRLNLQGKVIPIPSTSVVTIQLAELNSYLHVAGAP